MESNPKNKNEKAHPLKNIEEETMRHLEEKFNEIKNNKIGRASCRERV